MVPTHGEVYSIQHYVIKCHRSVGFSGYFDFIANKTGLPYITEILLKVLNTHSLAHSD